MRTQPVCEWVNCDLRLTLLGEELRAHVRVPTSPVRAADLVPVLHSLADGLVAVVLRLLAAQGKSVSCRAGCAACCEGLVPVAHAEALYLSELVAAMPPPRRAAIRTRFEAVSEQLGRSQVLGEIMKRMESGHPDVGGELGAAYLKERVPCPFLENDACSIYPQRPTVCREHLVTSPPSDCRDPERAIERVFLPARISPVLFRFSDGAVWDTARAVPMASVLAWAEAREEEAGTRLPGTRLFEGFLREFSRTQLGHEMAPDANAP